MYYNVENIYRMSPLFLVCHGDYRNDIILVRFSTREGNRRSIYNKHTQVAQIVGPLLALCGDRWEMEGLGMIGLANGWEIIDSGFRSNLGHFRT